MTESTTSASASESATYPSAYAPRAALPSAYSNRGGALHGRAASFDFIATTSNSGRHTSASKKSNVAFVSHQKQPSEQFDTIAAARLWLHSPSLVSNGSASASPAAAASPAVSSRGAFPIRPDSPQKAATRALSPAREAPTMPQRAVVAASAVTPAMPRQRSAKSTDNSAPGAVSHAGGVCRPRPSPSRRTALGIADLMALQAGRSKVGGDGRGSGAAARTISTSPAATVGVALQPGSAPRTTTAPPAMIAPTARLPPQSGAPFCFPSISQINGADSSLSVSPPSAFSGTGAQFALRKSPPHANPRGSAAMRFPRSMSDGQAVPRGSSRAKPAFPIVARAETNNVSEPSEPDRGSADLPSLHQACPPGSAVVESRGAARVGRKSRLGQGWDGSGSNSSSRDSSPSGSIDTAKCDNNECSENNVEEAAAQSRGGLGMAGAGMAGAGMVGSGRGRNISKPFPVIAIPTDQNSYTSPSSPTFRLSPLVPRGPSPLSPRVSSPCGPSPLFNRHPSPLSPCMPPPVSPWGPSPLSPRASPLSPRRPSPLSPRGPSPLSPRGFSPLSPRRPSPLSPRVVAPRPSPLHTASGLSSLKEHHSAGSSFAAASVDLQRVMNRNLVSTRSDNSILPNGAGWATESAAAAVACGVPKSILALKDDEGAITRTRSLDRRVRFNREVEVHVFS
ncbi:unnamed protein product [Closterium sp. NIES-65]|nr:unnamed protein product [Closterium sp. NIES-65]